VVWFKQIFATFPDVLKMTLDSEGLKSNSKIIILVHFSKSVKHSLSLAVVWTILLDRLREIITRHTSDTQQTDTL